MKAHHDIDPSLCRLRSWKHRRRCLLSKPTLASPGLFLSSGHSLSDLLSSFDGAFRLRKSAYHHFEKAPPALSHRSSEREAQPGPWVRTSCSLNKGLVRLGQTSRLFANEPRLVSVTMREESATKSVQSFNESQGSCACPAPKRCTARVTSGCARLITYSSYSLESGTRKSGR